MAEKASKHLKGVFVAEDIADESTRIMQSRCSTLQHYSYDCHKSRNESGIPYGGTVASVLQFTIRVSEPGECNFFYKHLKNNDAIVYSFLFNATFDKHLQLALYDDAISVKGFVVNIKETYRSDVEEQMLLTIQVLLKEITYIGKDSNKTLSITR